MKRILLVVVAIVALSFNARASVGLSISADALENAAGSLITDGTGLVLIVADTSQNGFAGTIGLGQSLAVGAFLGGGDDEIVAKHTVGVGGWGDGTLDVVDGLTLGAPWGAGDGIALYWFSDATTASASAAGGMHYNLNASTKDANWVTPADGNNQSMGWFTTDGGNLAGGDVPAVNGRTSLVVVPEPSSVMLVGLGLLGMIGLIRRRS